MAEVNPATGRRIQIVDFTGGNMCPRAWHLIKDNLREDQDVHCKNIGQEGMEMLITLPAKSS